MSRQPSFARAPPEVIELSSDEDDCPARPARKSYREENGYLLVDDESPPPRNHPAPSSTQAASRISDAPQSSTASKAELFSSLPGNASPRAEKSSVSFEEPQIMASPKQVEPPRRNTPKPVELPRKQTPQLVESPERKTPQRVDSPRMKTPQPVEPLRMNSPQGAGRALSARFHVPTSQVASESEDSEAQDIAQELRASTGTPSKSSSAMQLFPKSQSSSTGTDSPLIPHWAEKKQKSRPAREASAGQKGKVAPLVQSQIPLPSADLVKALQGFKEDMEEDHRTVTYWKLHDAKLAIEDAPKSKFDESTDPFASLASVYKTQEEPLPEGCVQERADHWTFNKASKGTKAKITYLAAITFNDNIPRVPSYQSHTNVRRNILTADDENLKYIPYLGDQPKDDHHDQLVQDLEEQFVRTRAEDIQDFERATKLRMWLTSWLETLNIGLDQQNLKLYVLSLPKIDEKLRVKKTEIKLLQTSASYPLDSEKAATSARFYKAFKEVFKINLEKVVLPKDQLKEMIDTAVLKSNSSPHKLKNEVPHRLGTYLELTCLICGVVDCPTHGEFEDQDRSDQDSEEETSPRFQTSRQKVAVAKKEHEQFNQRQHSDLAFPYSDTLMRYLSQKATRPREEPLKNTGPCSEECYMSDRYSGRVFELDQSVIDAIQDMMIALNDPTYQSCHIAFSLGIPCWQVHTEVVKCLEGNLNDPRLEPPALVRTKRPDWYDNKKKTLKSDWKDLTSAHLHQARLNSNSCVHDDGPCTSQCPCVSRNILCERFCGCGDDCPRKFTGCSCHTLGVNCISEHCICIAMNRECGPECVSCGAIDRINPANKHQDALFATGCQNIPLQRGVFKKLVMGESQLEGTGFGIYLLETARKGDFLSEYTGEVISHAEAERRGIIYDRKLMSFLFNLNASYVIDAARFGNKTRFINHSGGKGLNCEAKIVLVNGEHRIKFIALKDISVGTELLFNYGPEFAAKHGLNVTLPSAEDADKSDEALGAKIGRGQIKPVRGRSGGRGGRKAASKSAPKSKIAKGVKRLALDEDGDVTMEDEIEPSQDLVSQEIVIPEDDEDDEDFYGSPMEEDDEDREGSGSGEDGDDEPKPKRQIRRPTRYTR